MVNQFFSIPSADFDNPQDRQTPKSQIEKRPPFQSQPEFSGTPESLRPLLNSNFRDRPFSNVQERPMRTSPFNQPQSNVQSSSRPQGPVSSFPSGMNNFRPSSNKNPDEQFGNKIIDNMHGNQQSSTGFSESPQFGLLRPTVDSLSDKMQATPHNQFHQVRPQSGNLSQKPLGNIHSNRLPQNNFPNRNSPQSENMSPTPFSNGQFDRTQLIPSNVNREQPQMNQFGVTTPNDVNNNFATEPMRHQSDVSNQLRPQNEFDNPQSFQSTRPQNLNSFSNLRPISPQQNPDRFSNLIPIHSQQDQNLDPQINNKFDRTQLLSPNKMMDDQKHPGANFERPPIRDTLEIIPINKNRRKPNQNKSTTLSPQPFTVKPEINTDKVDANTTPNGLYMPPGYVYEEPPFKALLL